MLIVKKYGGSSLASQSNIEMIAKNISKKYKDSHQLAIVVSAMGKNTNHLYDSAEKLFSKTPINSMRELDALVSTGEQISSALLAIALNKINVPAKSYNGWQMGLLTDNEFQNANFLKLRNIDKIKAELNNGIVPIITGFQGVTINDDITTLGRNASDLSAIIIAQHLNADECQIYTDVDGIYDSDPNKFSDATKFNSISISEALALAQNGAKVVATKALEILKNHYMPVRVLHYREETKGTLITQTSVTKNKTIGKQEAFIARQVSAF